MKQIKDLIKRRNEYIKLANDYTSNRDYVMAGYYYNRADWVQNELVEEERKRIKERSQARKIKEKNKEN